MKVFYIKYHELIFYFLYSTAHFNSQIFNNN